MSDSSDRLTPFLVDAYGGDPFAHVRAASNEHREAHGPDCGVYPSGPVKMRVIATLVEATGARRILEIGCGLGYSALWLARAAGPDGQVDTIDRFQEHVQLSRGFAAEAGLADRLDVIQGEAADVLESLTGPYDLVHDDGWFGEEPPYFERVVDLLRPGGLLVMSNWFLLAESLADEPAMDWSTFSGPTWASDIQAYARRLASHPRLTVSFVPDPGLALAVRTE